MSVRRMEGYLPHMQEERCPQSVKLVRLRTVAEGDHTTDLTQTAYLVIKHQNNSYKTAFLV